MPREQMSGEFAHQMRALHERERRISLTVLRETPAPQAATTLVGEAMVRASAFVDDLNLPQEYTPACREGCSWCCRGGNVELMAPEAVAIAEYLRQHLDDSALGRLRQRIQEDAHDTRTHSTAARYAAQVPCPLLEESTGKCIAYDVRPAVCRGWNSLDAADCEADLKSGSLRRESIGHMAVIYGTFAMTQTALEDVCRSAGLDARSFQIGPALDIALDPSAGERWARGERVFDAAMTQFDSAQPSSHPAITADPDERRRARNSRKAGQRKRGR